MSDDAMAPRRLREKTQCRLCAGRLETDGARAIGVCVTCIQQGGGARPWPRPPGYGFNPSEPAVTAPPRPE